MHQLVTEGFLERERKRGTFVRAPNQASTIGILIGPQLSDETAHFYRAILKNLREMLSENENSPRDHRIYDGITEDPQTYRQSPSYRHFLADAASHAFSGVIDLTGNPALFSEVKSHDLLPTSRLWFDVNLDFRHFATTAMEMVAPLKPRSILYLRGIDDKITGNGDLEGLMESAAVHHLPHPRVIPLQTVRQGGSLVEAEAHRLTTGETAKVCNGESGPVAILISDDIAARGAALALAQAGADIAGKFALFTSANRGVTHHYGIPVRRCEFDLRELCSALFEILDCRTQHLRMPPLPLMIPCKWTP